MARIEDSMGITYRQLDHWCKEGYLRPETGAGSQRVWPETEIRIGRMMSRLVAIGFTPGQASGYARSSIVDGATMLLELNEGKLKVRGPFSSAVKRALRVQQETRNSRGYVALDSEEKAC